MREPWDPPVIVTDADFDPVGAADYTRAAMREPDAWTQLQWDTAATLAGVVMRHCGVDRAPEHREAMARALIAMSAQLGFFGIQLQAPPDALINMLGMAGIHLLDCTETAEDDS